MITCTCNEYPLIPLSLYSKTGVCRGMPIFSYFCSKILKKKNNKKIKKKKSNENSIFTPEKISILHGQVFDAPQSLSNCKADTLFTGAEFTIKFKSYSRGLSFANNSVVFMAYSDSL